VTPGDRFPLSPAHRFTAGVGATRAAGRLRIDGELSLRGVSSQFLRGDEANALAPLPGYAVSDLRVGVDHARYGLTLRVANLFDRRYESFGVYAGNPRGDVGGPPPAVPRVERFLTPGYPRALTVALEVKS
jgi:outer membrane receptor protein involved in Fe transport